MINPASDTLLVNSMVCTSLLFWGAWGIFDKKALSHTTPAGQLAAVYCFSPLLALGVLTALAALVPGWHLSTHTLIYEGLASLAYFIATISYLLAMSKGEASLVLGATASYPVVAQLLAFLVLAEPLVPARLIGCLVVVAGIIAIGGSSKKAEAKGINLNRDLVITVIGIILAVLGWAFRGIFDKIAIDAAHPLEVNLGKYIWDSIIGAVAVGWIFFKRDQIPFFKAKGLWPCATGSAICLAGGSAAYYVALSMVSASYAIAITGCYPVVMYLLALVVLKEKFNVPRAVGIALITLGGILTQTTQSF